MFSVIDLEKISTVIIFYLKMYKYTPCELRVINFQHHPTLLYNEEIKNICFFER